MNPKKSLPIARWKRGLCYLLINWLVWQPVMPAFAATITAANGNTTLDQAANGVPIVNIATPNQAGISHNQYNDFNVGKEGLLLNNATGRLTPTQIGGLVQNNPHLQAGQEAKAIINEVVSGNASQLNGYIEVAGNAAKVMVANPYGITCNGCGFLNTPHATLTTGKPTLGADGNLQSLDVTQGTITIEGQGLDASHSDGFALVSRAAQINAGLYANDLQIKLGANHVDAQGNITPIAGGTKPVLAIDTGALGGMYANRIHLVSSEQGVGVNLGNLKSSVGEMQIDANGKLSLGNATASGNITANAQQITLQGTQQAGGDVSLNSQGELAVQNSQLTSGGNIAINTGSLSSSSQAQVVAAGNINASASGGGQWQGTLSAGNTLVLNSGDFINNGQMLANGNSYLTTHSLSNTGKVQANASQQIQTNSLHNSGTLAASGAMQVRVQQALNQDAGGLLNAGGGLDVSAGSASLGGLLVTDNALNAQFGQLTTNSGSQIQAASDALVQANDWAMLQGSLRAGSHLNLSSGSLNSGSDAQVYAVGAVQASAGNGLWLGSLTSGADLQLNTGDFTNNGTLAAAGNSQVSSQKLTNGGLIQAQGQQALAVSTLSNSGKLQSAGMAQIHADTLDNQGLIGSQQGLGLQVTTSLTVANSGTLFAGDQLTIAAGNASFNGTQTGKNGLILNATSLDAGQGSLINSLGNIQLTAGQQGLNGTLSTTGNISLITDYLSVGTLGSIHSDQDLAIAASLQATVSGALAGQTVEAQGGALQVTANGSLTSQRDMQLSATQQQLDGITSAGGDLAINANQLNAASSGKTSAQGDINAGVTVNGQWLGSLIAGQDLTFAADNFTNGGTLAANRNGQFSFQTLNNSGVVQSLASQSLSGNTLNNSGSSQSGGDQWLTVTQVNNLGQLGAQGALTLSSDTLTSGDSSSLLTNGLLTLHATQAQLGGSLTAAQGAILDASTLTSNSASQQTSQGDITINAVDAQLNGLLSADGNMTLNTQQLLTGSDSQTQGKLSLTLSALQQAQLAGRLVTPAAFTLQAGSLSTTGSLGANQVALHASTLTNQGAISASDSLNIQADTLQQQGTLSASNQMQLTANTLSNSGTISAGDLGVNAIASLDNQPTGVMSASRSMTLTMPQLSNEGSLMAPSLTINASGVSNYGLLQGNSAATLTADNLTNALSGQVLSGGLLNLKSELTSNQGRLQGNQLTLTGNSLNNGGTMLGSNGLSAQLLADINNSGTLLTQGAATLNGATLENSGQLLSSQAANLTAIQMTNQGQIQGAQLALTASELDNSGNLIGLNNLTVQLQQDLHNAASGQIMTQGALTVAANQVINNGTWQADSALLHASQLDVNGTIQTASSTELDVNGALNTQSQGKILSNGSSIFQAGSLNNQGNWAASNLSLAANTLTDSGTVSAVNQLTATINGTLQVHQGASLLGGATSTLNAAEIDNSGEIAANNLQLSSNRLVNDGQLLGQQNLQGTIQNDINNLAGATLRSQGTLVLSGQTLLNQGQLQGDGISQLTLANNLNNQGSLLTGGRLTLSVPALINSGVLQAQGLTLNSDWLTNAGTLTGLGDSSLTANQITNQGQLQGDNLQLNGNSLQNSGTLFASQALNINEQTSDNQQSGKLYSAGNLSLASGWLNPAGSVLALGNMTLQLGSGFTQTGTLAAGQSLSLNTQGDLNIQGVVQGNSIQLGASGNVVNDGQLRAGNGSLTVDAGNITLNGDGSVQSGGDMRLSSGGQVTNSGFVGTASNLLMLAAGQLVNTALLYAGNNMQLLADSIHNNYGDILAANSLWMQRDTAGHANSEVVNTSGDIETSNGDITINTGHLLNQRDGLAVSNSYQLINSPASGAASAIQVRLGDLSNDQLGIFHNDYTYVDSSGGDTGQGAVSYIDTTQDFLAPNQKGAVQKYLIATSTIAATANGGAGRIAANNNLNITAGALDNIASNLLAGSNITLSGVNLNNQSATNSIQNEYLVYTYSGDLGEEHPDNQDIIAVLNAEGWWGYYRNGHVNTADSTVTYNLSSAPQYETISTGEGYRAVIQAGGGVNASFSNDISNTNTTANAGSLTHTISTPGLSGTSGLQTLSAAPNQQMAAGQHLAIGSPSWHDALATALQQIGNSGAALADYPLPTSNNGLFVINSDPASPYLITTNPQLNSVGKTDPSLFNGLNSYLSYPISAVATLGSRSVSSASNASGTLAAIPAAGQVVNPVVQGGTPTTPVTETRAVYTDASQFIGSSYFMSRLNLTPDYNYKFLGDAAFDTRYVSNAVLSQTGQRYIAGLGSDLQQMQYLINNAADQQSALGLQLGVSLSADQVSQLTKSIVWWEKTTVDGQTVLAPKLYLAAADTQSVSGSVISGDTVNLAADHIVNAGSSMLATTQLTASSNSTLDNLSAGLIKSNASLQLSSLGDINNIGSTISGQTVELASLTGSINNLTQSQLWRASGNTSNPTLTFSDTLLGDTATIQAGNSLLLSAGKNINVTGATVSSGGTLALQAGQDIAINANALSSDKTNFSGTTTRTLSSDSQASSVTAGGNLYAAAGHNITLAASQLTSKGDTSLLAGNDINLNVMDKSSQQFVNNGQTVNNNATRSSVSSNGSLSLTAGNDISSQAAQLAADLNANLTAGHDINLNAQQTRSYSENHTSNSESIRESIAQQGTQLTSGGATSLQAGQDITTQAASVQANGDLVLSAGRDININSATQSDYSYDEATHTSHHLFSSTTTHTIAESYATTEQGSQLSGNNVTLSAGHDLGINGSSVVGSGDVTLQAGNNLNITAATEQQSSYQLNEKKTSGLFSGGGFGLTIGSQSTRQQINQDATTQSQSSSAVGSTGGNVNLLAGGAAHISGSDVIAKNNLNMVAGSVTIDPGNDTLTRKQIYEQKQSGLTLSLSSPITDAALSLANSAQQVSSTGDDRLKALYSVQAVQNAWAANKYNDVAKDANQLLDGQVPGSLQIQLSIGASKSSSSSDLSQNVVSGSSLSAGRNVAIMTTGNNGQSGDLSITGSGVTGNNITLSAQRDLLLQAGSDNTTQTSSNSSSGWAAGVHASLGSSTGIGIQASGYYAGGSSDGTSTDYVNTRINAQNSLSLSSGRDTTLSGAQALGDKITANVGRDLTLTSLQDSDNYQSQQHSVSGGGNLTFGTPLTGSASFSASQSKMQSSYASVGAQSGLFAGNQGFDINVDNHTQLNGAVIASTANAVNNSLSTGSLGWQAIINKADYTASSGALSGGFSSTLARDNDGNTKTDASNNPLVKNQLDPALPAYISSNGSAMGVSQSAIAAGNIIIRNPLQQTQDVSSLSRDTQDANGHIDKIFDQQKIANNQALAQGISQLAPQLISDVSSSLINSAKAKVESRADYQSANEAQRQALLDKDPDYQNAQKEFGIGSPYWAAASAVSGALAGLSGANAGSALAGGLAPYLSLAVKNATTDANNHVNEAANLAGHALAGALVAYLQGGSAAAGAVGGSSGEVAASIVSGIFYPGIAASELSEEQKANISAVSSLAAGLAGGIIGDSSMAGVQAAAAGKTAVENNYLSSSDITTFLDKYAKAKTEEEKEKLREELKQKDAAQQEQAQATGISVKDQKAELEKLKALMASPDCNAECQSLAAYSISQLEPVANDTQLHKDNLVKDGLVAVIFGITDGISSGAGKAKSQEVSATAKAEKSALDDILQGENQAAKNTATTGTVFDSIKGTQPVYPGSVIPKSFEMSLPNGQKVWLHGNATEHMVEYAASKAVTHTPEAVKLASQEELRSFQAAVNTATKNNMPYGERVTVDGWQLEIKPPRADGELPTVIHARYMGAH